MQEFLLFRLYGAMASWGDIAVGDYRPSYSHPSKSAVLGLLAAAKGVKREEEAVHSAMAESYGFAVRIDAAGNLMRDYHTIQAPPEAALKNHPSATRRDELNALKRYQLDYPKVSGTILSSRDYYCDALYTVCVSGCAKERSRHSLLESLKRRLKNRALYCIWDERRVRHLCRWSRN